MIGRILIAARCFVVPQLAGIEDIFRTLEWVTCQAVMTGKSHGS